MSDYKHTKDFVAFLRSPLTKKVEFEIIITAQPSLINEFENLLMEKNIVYRKSPIVVFPPPFAIIIDESALVDCFTELLTWYSRNKERNILVKFMDWEGNISEISSEHSIQKFINLYQKK